MTMNLASDDQIVIAPKLRAGVDKSTSSNAKPAKTQKAPAGPTATPAIKQAAGTKAAVILRKLATAKGATLEQLMEATAWQAHSVRGFLSGTVKKELGLTLISEVGKDGVRRYRTDGAARV